MLWGDAAPLTPYCAAVHSPNSPEVNTPHKARNGVHSITCRNRHCPKCQSSARDHWLLKQAASLLPVPYVHAVFTVPEQLAPVALCNQRLFYSMLFRAASETLLRISADRRYLGAGMRQCRCGWKHPRPQYPECGRDRSQGFLSIPSSARFHPTDPTQTETWRWRRIGDRSPWSAAEDSDVDVVTRQRGHSYQPAGFFEQRVASISLNTLLSPQTTRSR